MKRITILMTAFLLAACCLSACGKGTDPKGDSGKIRIVTTIFPEYDWVMNILGDKAENAEVTMLLDNGVDIHSYQPSASDILKIASCDLFIYVGGESDDWVKNALQEAVNADMLVISLMDVLGDAVKEEEEIEGMQEDHEHEHEDGDGHDHDEEKEYDEHVWLSLRNAAVLTEKISEAIEHIDAANAEAYRTNTAAYTGKLKALDEEYKAVTEQASFTTLLFGDRFPFRYLTDDYGLSYYAAFAGCSAETEASFETIVFLAGKIDELSLPAVITIEGSDRRIAETIVQNTRTKDQKILTMDSLQSVTAKDLESGASYLAAMEKNLSILKDALR